jgi:hypothetical protein
MAAACGVRASCFAGARRISHEDAWGWNCWGGLRAAAVAFADGRRLAEGWGGWPLVALGCSATAFAPHSQVWTGTLNRRSGSSGVEIRFGMSVAQSKSRLAESRAGS